MRTNFGYTPSLRFEGLVAIFSKLITNLTAFFHPIQFRSPTVLELITLARR